ncbi:hypothetical protein PL81_22725, partial [Streptomyces sp. RSD-27]
MTDGGQAGETDTAAETTEGRPPAPAADAGSAEAGAGSAGADAGSAEAGRGSAEADAGSAEAGAGRLSAAEAAVLAYEGRSWPGPGAKERAIREGLGLSPVRYYQLLNALMDDP